MSPLLSLIFEYSDSLPANKPCCFFAGHGLLCRPVNSLASLFVYANAVAGLADKVWEAYC